MRKFLLITFLAFILVLITSTFVLADSTIKVGYHFNGLLDVDGATTQNVDPGITLGYEYTAKGENLEYGAGVEYQFDKDLKDSTATKFYFVPVYALIHCVLTENEYIIAKVGYNFFDGNPAFKTANPGTLNGGFYYAAGAGMNYKNLRVEVLYSCNGASISNSSTKNIKNSQWAVNFGLRF